MATTGESGLSHRAARSGAPKEIVSPGGTRVELASEWIGETLGRIETPLLIQHASAEDSWVTGRAGMQYRDLLPQRAAGHFILSHIRIPEGGPVPDYVHYHRVDLQLIYCLEGWVKVVYEDQGEPFVMKPGDCVLQPPEIRHRVLECSSGLEVFEVGAPALHETRTDPDMELPNGKIDRERDFSGQRFLHHRHEHSAASKSTWPGFVDRDTGLAQATGDLASLSLLEAVAEPQTFPIEQDRDFRFWFLRAGRIELTLQGVRRELKPGDAITLPKGIELEINDWALGTLLLDFAR